MMFRNYVFITRPSLGSRLEHLGNPVNLNFTQWINQKTGSKLQSFSRDWHDHGFHDPRSDHDHLEKCDPRSDHDHLVQKK